MYKKTIHYTDYNGVEKTEDFYFNLTKAELVEKEMSTPGGLSVVIKRITDKVDAPLIMKTFKELLLESYGERTGDGRFRKSKQLSEEFSQTAAYDKLFMELVTDGDAAAKFISGIIPGDIDKKQLNEAVTAAGIKPVN